MSTKWPGGIISKTAPTITAPTAGVGGSASGRWTMDEVLVHEKQVIGLNLHSEESFGLGEKPVVGNLVMGLLLIKAHLFKLAH